MGEVDRKPNLRADELLSRVFRSLLDRKEMVASLRLVANLGRPLAEAQLRAKHEGYARRLESTSDFDHLFRDKKGFFNLAGGVPGITSVLTDRELQDARTATDSAAIVFIHASLDAATSDLCEVVAIAAPEAWEPWLEKKQVPILKVRASSFESLRDELLRDHLSQLQRESLATRVDRLHALSKPVQGAEILKGFSFDLERLKALDTLRQRIAHGSDFEHRGEEVADDIEFMFKSGMYLLSLVAVSFNVGVHPRLVFGVPPELLNVEQDVAER